MPATIDRPFLPGDLDASARSIFENSTVLALTVRVLGNSRKVDPSAVEVDADRSLLSVSKRLYESDEYSAITQADAALRKTLNRFRVGQVFKGGVLLIPTARVAEVHAILGEWETTREALVQAFCAAYEDITRRSVERLRALGRWGDFALQSDVAAAFRVSWVWLEIQTPTNLSRVSPEAYHHARQAFIAQWAEAAEEVRALLRGEALKLVSHLHERLTTVNPQTGRPQQFQRSAVEKIQSWLDLFSDRNIAGDAQLEAIVADVRAMVSGVSVDALRSPGQLRNMVADQAGQIAERLDALLIDGPSRFITFDEELN